MWAVSLYSEATVAGQSTPSGAPLPSRAAAPIGRLGLHSLGRQLMVAKSRLCEPASGAAIGVIRFRARGILWSRNASSSAPWSTPLHRFIISSAVYMEATSQLSTGDRNTAGREGGGAQTSC